MVNKRRCRRLKKKKDCAERSPNRQLEREGKRREFAEMETESTRQEQVEQELSKQITNKESRGKLGGVGGELLRETVLGSKKTEFQRQRVEEQQLVEQEQRAQQEQSLDERETLVNENYISEEHLSHISKWLFLFIGVSLYIFFVYVVYVNFVRKSL